MAEMNLVPQHEHIKDLGVFMSADCSFDHHISVISKKCSSIAGWILRTFTSRDRTPMLTLFKSIVLSRLDLVVSFGLHIKPSTLIPLKKSKDLSQNTSVGCTLYHTVKD